MSVADYPQLWPLFASFALFQLKHYLFDFLFQTRYQLANKGTYGHFGGILHAGLHALASVPALALLEPPPWLIGALIAGEFLVHYHMDWLKEQILRRMHWTTSDFGYWQALGIDQMVHHLTYIAMLAAVVY